MSSPARATTDLEVANLALSMCKEPPIGSFDESNRTAARAAKKWYGTALDLTLARTDWNFASAWDKPAKSTTAGIGRLKNSFPLRSDTVKVREVFDGEPSDATRLGAEEWEVENAITTVNGAETQAKVLVCAIDNPTIRYTRRVTNIALWDGDDTIALAHTLARYLAPELGKSAAEVGALKTDATEATDAAANTDAREGSRGQVSRNTSWIAARRGVRNG